MSGAFAVAAPGLSRAGLAVVPLGGAKGQTPLVHSWTKWKHPPGPASIEKLSAKHPGANIGIACGLSGVVVVDIDDLSHALAMIERFGDTPLKVQTPRGDGIHLWYRSSGEGCQNLRDSEGLPVDLKGIGGLVVVPPSTRPSGEFAGRSYTIISGSWD